MYKMGVFPTYFPEKNPLSTSYLVDVNIGFASTAPLYQTLSNQVFQEGIERLLS